MRERKEPGMWTLTGEAKKGRPSGAMWTASDAAAGCRGRRWWRERRSRRRTGDVHAEQQTVEVKRLPTCRPGGRQKFRGGITISGS